MDNSEKVYGYGELQDDDRGGRVIGVEFADAWVEVCYDPTTEPLIVWRGYKLPETYEAQIEDRNLPYRVRLRMRVMTSGPRCEAMTLVSEVRRITNLQAPVSVRDVRVSDVEHNRLTSAGLRTIPVQRLERLATLAAVHGTDGQLLSLDEWDEFYRDANEEPVPRSRFLSKEHYAQVARIYRAALRDGLQPVVAVEKQLHTSRSTAGRWVAAARDRGLLGPAPAPGRPGEELSTKENTHE